MCIHWKPPRDSLDFPRLLYGSTKNGCEGTSIGANPPQSSVIPAGRCGQSISLALETEQGATQMLITSPSNFFLYPGQVAIRDGMHRGTIRDPSTGCIDEARRRSDHQEQGEGTVCHSKVEKQKVEEAGEICALVGLEGFEIGDTISGSLNQEAMGPSPSMSRP